MKVFKYWFRKTKEIKVNGKEIKAVDFGFSNESIEASKLESESQVQSLANWVLQKKAEHYPYANKALREEVKEEIKLNEEIYGAITRAAYGSLALNTKEIMLFSLTSSLENISQKKKK